MRRRRERGHLLVWAAVFGILAMAYWALAFRTTSDLIRSERAAILRAARDDGVARAAAAGIALLRTGLPPDAPYTCIVTPPGGRACRVVFVETGEPDEWTVTAEPATDDDVVAWPAAPATFAE